MNSSGWQLFSIRNIPVAVGPFYLILLLFWTLGGDLASGLIWGAVVTLSILIHELGHAAVAKKFGLGPRILLHGLGGQCAHERANSDRDDALIIIAGPLAGLCLGALAWLYHWSGITITSGPALRLEQDAVSMLIYVNIFWSLVNLLPLYPLDGGQLFRLGVLRLMPALKAEKLTFWLGIALSAIWIYVGWQQGGFGLLMILGIWILFANIQALQSGGPPVRTVNRHAKQLFKEAEAAFEQGDYATAFRIGHQVRADSNLPQGVVEKSWRVLGVSAARVGEHREAMSFLRKATATPDVIEAKIECLAQLGRNADLKALIKSEEFQLLAEERRSAILEIVLPEGEQHTVQEKTGDESTATP